MNINNRGKTLGFITLAINIGRVIGPIMHGVLFDINIYYPMYIAGSSIFVSIIFWIILVVTTKPSLKIKYKDQTK